VTTAGAWADSAFGISWNISQDVSGNWTYEYTFTNSAPAVSHFILEVTQDDNPFNIYEISGTYDGPDTWAESTSNPGLPNAFYGIKFEDGLTTYTIVTDRAPVYGVFYAKGGRDGGAWSDALNFPDYKTNGDLTKTDFIVRPNGNPVPIPAAAWLLGSGILGLAGIRLRSRKKK